MTELTRRQRQILVLLANGRTIKSAAVEMGINYQTAKNHLTEAYRALGVSSRWAAFLELGWLTPPVIRDGKG